MPLSQWLQQLAQRWCAHDRIHRRPARRNLAGIRRTVRPRVEVLEDRLTPSGNSVVIGTTYSPVFVANQWSGAIAIRLLDSHGNPVESPGTTFKLSSNSSGGQFRDLSGGLVNSVSIPSGEGGGPNTFALFEYEDSQTGTPTITA